MIGKSKHYRGLWSDVTALQRQLCQKLSWLAIKHKKSQKKLPQHCVVEKNSESIFVSLYVWCSILFCLSNAPSYNVVNPVVGVIQSAAHTLVYVWDRGRYVQVDGCIFREMIENRTRRRDTTRERARPPPIESSETCKMRHVELIPHRMVGLISS